MHLHSATTTHGDGPYFEDFVLGATLAPAPAMTLTEAMAGHYAAIVGDPFAPTLSRPLAAAIGAGDNGLLNPALVLHASIGQSTVATRRVVANLFYRGVALQKQLGTGATVFTEVRIAGLRETTRKPGRPLRGMALLAIATTDEQGDVVAEYERCALVPFRSDADTGHHDDLGSSTADFDAARYRPYVPTGWNLDPLGAPDPWTVGDQRVDAMADTVSGAMELVRLTQNQAAVHRDVRLSPNGQRLVYGGHTIGLAQASLARMLPSMAYVLGWVGCDHVGPVYEGDLLSSAATLDHVEPLDVGRMLAFTVDTWAHRGDAADHVLRWQPVIYAA